MLQSVLTELESKLGPLQIPADVRRRIAEDAPLAEAELKPPPTVETLLERGKRDYPTECDGLRRFKKYFSGLVDLPLETLSGEHRSELASDFVRICGDFLEGFRRYGLSYEESCHDLEPTISWLETAKTLSDADVRALFSRALNSIPTEASKSPQDDKVGPSALLAKSFSKRLAARNILSPEQLNAIAAVACGDAVQLIKINIADSGVSVHVVAAVKDLTVIIAALKAQGAKIPNELASAIATVARDFFRDEEWRWKPMRGEIERGRPSERHDRIFPLITSFAGLRRVLPFEPPRKSLEALPEIFQGSVEHGIVVYTEHLSQAGNLGVPLTNEKTVVTLTDALIGVSRFDSLRTRAAALRVTAHALAAGSPLDREIVKSALLAQIASGEPVEYKSFEKLLSLSIAPVDELIAAVDQSPNPPESVLQYLMETAPERARELILGRHGEVPFSVLAAVAPKLPSGAYTDYAEDFRRRCAQSIERQTNLWLSAEEVSDAS